MTDNPINNTVKRAKEFRRASYVYSHECPHCGESIDDYTESECGVDAMECLCGELYVLEKGW